MLSKNLLAVAAAAAPAAFAQSTPNLTALVASDDRLSTLQTILQTFPDVASSLAQAQNVTLFAPTNQAFQSYLSNNNLQLSDVSSDMVAALLNYHVVNGTITAANITDSPQFIHTFLMNDNYTTVEGGQVLEAQMEDGNAIITSGYKTQAQVVEADLNYTNGIAHIIDGVNVIPPNASALASAANLTAFLGALELANLTDAVLGLDDVTIFAPSNSAFADIGTALSNISTSALVNILQAHVINGTIAYSPSIGNGSVETLGGAEVNLTVADGAIFVNQARVVNADNLISNGVLHVINAVINPNGTAAPNPSNDNPQGGFAGATTLSGGLIPAQFTSGLPAATTTGENLISTTADVASGYSTNSGGAINSGAGGPGATDTSTEGAAMVTGALGMAALFGGAAFAANF